MFTESILFKKQERKGLKTDISIHQIITNYSKRNVFFTTQYKLTAPCAVSAAKITIQFTVLCAV